MKYLIHPFNDRLYPSIAFNDSHDLALNPELLQKLVDNYTGHSIPEAHRLVVRIGTRRDESDLWVHIERSKLIEALRPSFPFVDSKLSLFEVTTSDKVIFVQAIGTLEALNIAAEKEVVQNINFQVKFICHMASIKQT